MKHVIVIAFVLAAIYSFSALARPTLHDRGTDKQPDLTELVNRASKDDLQREKLRGTGGHEDQEEDRGRDDSDKSFDEQDNPKDYE